MDGKGPFYIYGSKSLSYPEQRGTVEIIVGWGKGSDSGRLYRIVVESLEEKQIYQEPLGQTLESKNLPLVSTGSVRFINLGYFGWTFDFFNQKALIISSTFFLVNSC